MIRLLAQAGSPSNNVFDVVINVFSRGDTLAHPGDMVTALQSMSVVWAVVFLTAGITCLFNGYKFYKSVTVIAALAMGMFLGYYLGKKVNAEYIVAGCMGVLFAVGCYPLMKYAVAVFGGLVGAFLGANLWSAVARIVAENNGGNAQVAEHYWIGALIGLLICGMLAFILFKLSVVLFTSVSGSTIAVLGAVALLLQVPAWQEPVSQSISAHAVIIPLLVMVPAVIGFILQETPAGAAGAAAGAGGGEKKK